ncbi:MAG: pyridoxal-phosphate dependent enzyme [Conexibacter sp.]
MSTAPTITFADVEDAAARLRGVANRTPMLRSRTLDMRLDGEILFKAETFQRTGAFKFRGAYNCISRLTDRERRRGVVACSSGNHAQGVGLAAKLLRGRAVILMPDDAPAGKRAAVNAYGADVIGYDRLVDDCAQLADEIVAREGLTLVHGHDDPHVMAGAGTVALELIEEAATLDELVLPIGGGGLASGCAVAGKALLPGLRVVGVEPAASDATRQSLAANRRVHITSGASSADGLVSDAPGAVAFGVIKELVDEVVVVTEDEIAAATRFLFERMKLVVEPSGAASLAALLAGRIDAGGRRIGIVLTGGNVDLAKLATIH